MRSRGRLYQIVAILGPAILIVAGAAPRLVCHAGPPQAREAQPTQGRGTQVDLLAGSAPDANVCWVVGRNGAVFVTKGAGDGNKTAWNEVAAPVAADFAAVSAKSANSAIVTTVDGRQFETHDGGKKWKQANVSR